MTSIEDLRAKYGDSPRPLKGFKFEAGGHKFDVYMVRHRSGTTKTKAQITLRGGQNVEIEVDTPTEEENRSRRAYFQVSEDKPVLLFFESEQHVSDLLECKWGYAQEEERLIREHVKGQVAEQERVARALRKHDKLEDKIRKAEASFNLGYLTDVRYALLSEHAAEVSKWRGKLRAREKGPGKPDKSFLVPIRLHSPLQVAYPSARAPDSSRLITILAFR